MAMARLAELPHGTIQQIEREMGRRFGARELLKLKDNPVAWDMMLTALRCNHSAFRLEHGVYESQVFVHSATFDQLLEKGFDLKRFTWVGWESAGIGLDPREVPMTSPAFTDDPEIVVTLVPTLGTSEQTHSFLVQWLSEVLGASLHDHARDTRHHFEYWDEDSFEPWTLRWVRIKLDAHKGVHYGTRSVRTEVQKSALVGFEILAAMAQHPEALKARDGKDRSNFCLPSFSIMEKRGHDPDSETLLLIGGDNPRITSVSLDSGRWPQGLSFPVLVE